MTIFLTIFAGVTTFVLGQILLKLIIDPVQEFKRTVAEIAHSLIKYANIYSNPGVTGEENEQEVRDKMREFSSQLNSNMYLIPGYVRISKLFGLPTQENIVKASKHLIGLSNGFAGANPNLGIVNTYRAQHICDALGIYVAEHERLDPEQENEFIRNA